MNGRESPHQPLFKNTVAIIGSFHVCFNEMQRAADIFEDYGIRSVNPVGITPIDVTEPFVRFEEDDPNKTPQQLQEGANWRIINSPLVYVHCPGGYLGLDTEQEILVAIGDERPILFSAYPRSKSEIRYFLRDIAEDRVKTPDEAAHLLLNNLVNPLFFDESGKVIR